MKTILVGLLISLSSFAHADYFACQITVNKQSKIVEAEYQVYSASVELNGYKCEGRIEERITSTTVYAPKAYGTNSAIGLSDRGYSIAILDKDTQCLCGLQ